MTDNEPSSPKPIPFPRADHAKIAELRQKLTTIRGSKVSLRQTVMEGIKLLGERVDEGQL